MTWSVKAIRIEQVPKVWYLAARFLAPAVERSEGRYDLKAVFRQVIESRASLWFVTDEAEKIYCVFTTREVQYPCARYLCVDFLGGDDLAAWVEEVDAVLQNYASDAGLRGVEMYGRAGWARALQPFGWRKNGVMLVKHGLAG